MSIPTPTRRLTPWATPEKNRVQPLSISKVPEPTLCVEVSLTRSNWLRSTSRTSSGSFPPREVTFHVPKASKALRFHCHPSGSAPDPIAVSRRWWARGTEKRRCWAWLQKGTPGFFRAGYPHFVCRLSLGLLIHFSLTPCLRPICHGRPYQEHKVLDNTAPRSIRAHKPLQPVRGWFFREVGVVLRYNWVSSA